MSPAARQNRKLHTRNIRKQQCLERRACGGGQALPLLDRNEHCGLGSSTGDDLRAITLAGVQKLAEPSFRVLYRPNLFFHASHYMTSHMTSQLLGAVSAFPSPEEISVASA